MFETVNQVPTERQQRNVLVFDRGDVEDFELKGFDIAGGAIAALRDTRLLFVGVPEGKHEETRRRRKAFYAGCVGVRKNYWYVEWQWKVE